MNFFPNVFRGGLPPALESGNLWRSKSMNEEQYRKLLQRIAEHQKRLISQANAKDDFASVEKRLLGLLETTRKRIVREHGGQ
jgi:hypothetical protein